MEELKKRIRDLKQRLDFDQLLKEIKEIEDESSQPGFWQDQWEATAKMKRLGRLQKEVKEMEELEKLLKEGRKEELKKKLAQMEIKLYFSDKYDRANVIFSIHAGQGGTEAMDWAAMLQRMYLRYFDKKGWHYEIVDLNPGEEAGIKRVTMTVSDSFVYGYLKHEAGTHRLVRQSPFNADRLRQTSFALVEVLPQIKEVREIKIREEDLEWQFFRASTQGGQNVQKVSTAVRLKHKPSGIVVTCQSERHQEQNRKIALQILKAKLWAQARLRTEEEKKRLKKGRTKADWGSQIRSYILHPYKLVKDLRTGYQTSEVEAVLDGELDGFIEAEVKSML